MKKLSVSKLIEFRRKSDRSKKTFVENIKSDKIIVPTEGGGDYWVTSLSAVCNSFKQGDIELANEKIDELEEKLKRTGRSITKNMYQRNISILEGYKKMDLSKLRPNNKLSPLKKSSANPLLTIKGLQVEAKPSLVYIFGKKGEEKVGAIWFTAKVGGYQIEEVSMFCEVLYRFLRHNYSKQYQLIPKYCVSIEMLSGRSISYSEIEGGSFSRVLNPTLDEINKLM